MSDFFTPKGPTAVTFAAKLTQSLLAGMAFASGAMAAMVRLASGRDVSSLASDPAHRKSVLVSLDWAARGHGKRGDVAKMQQALDLMKRIEDTFPDCPYCGGKGSVFASQECGPCSGRGTLVVIRD